MAGVTPETATELPRFYERGPIEAGRRIRRAMTSRALPRFYERGPIEARPQSWQSFSSPCFRASMSAAPLKHRLKAHVRLGMAVLPRFYERGPIEARRFARPSR